MQDQILIGNDTASEVKNALSIRSQAELFIQIPESFFSPFWTASKNSLLLGEQKNIDLDKVLNSREGTSSWMNIFI